MRALLIAGIAAAALSACGPAPAKAPQDGGKAASSPQGDKVVDFADDDAEMNAAKAQARQTLPVFWKHLEAHPDIDHSLKVGLPTASGSLEHIWVANIRPEGDKVLGRLANAPVDLPGLEAGSPVTFTRDQISDWSYAKDGKMYGHYTTRVIVKRLDPAEAAQVVAMLSENPVEPDAR